MPFIGLFFIFCLIMILAIGTVPPTVLVWIDRRRADYPPPPLPKGLRILGRVILVFMTLVVIVGLATIFLIERRVADQERACKARGGTSYSLMDGCS
jgi:hypothetical protein